MVDVIENAVQLAVLAVCFAMCVYKAVSVRDRMWIILSFFYGCSFFSLVYWTSYLVAFGVTPRYSYASDLSWMASYIFLVIQLVEFKAQRALVPPVRVAWVLPVACVPACILFCTHGDILLNLADCSLMAAIGYLSTCGAVASSSSGVGSSRALHVSILVFAVAELALWTASCFWSPQMTIPYIVADYALTASYAAILACAWRTSLE